MRGWDHATDVELHLAAKKRIAAVLDRLVDASRPANNKTLAAEIGISDGTVSDLRRRKRERISRAMLATIAQAGGTTAVALLSPEVAAVELRR